jgi:hypothetical protein
MTLLDLLNKSEQGAWARDYTQTIQQGKFRSVSRSFPIRRPLPSKSLETNTESGFRRVVEPPRANRGGSPHQSPGVETEAHQAG